MSRNSLGESSGDFEVAGTACGKALWQGAAWYICVANTASVGNVVLEKGRRPEHTS